MTQIVDKKTKLILNWEEIREALYEILMPFGLFPRALEDLCWALRRLGVLPSDRIYQKQDTGQIIVITSTNEYLITLPTSADFFGLAEIERIK